MTPNNRNLPGQRTIVNQPKASRRRLPVCASAILFLLAQCAAMAQTNSAPSSTLKNSSVYAELANAPAKAAAHRNPLTTDPDAVAAGAKLFDLHCAECHGEMAEGGKKGPSLRAEEVQKSTPGALFWLLTNGVVRRGMPVWSKLPEPQRWQLVSYIKSLTPAVQPGADAKDQSKP
jgi:mono/diheme cytochrome c family protein